MEPILIVGAGPVGLTMAAELARYGLKVRIIDLAPQPTDKSKALVIWSRTLELLDRAACTQPFLDAGYRATGTSVYSGNERLAHLDFTALETPYPFALMLPQSETERLLTAHLKTLGVTVERSVELLSFTQSADHVTSTLRHPDGREETLQTAYLIGCDGAHSTVRHGLDSHFQGETEKSDWLLADVELEGVPNVREVSIIWHADGILALFPITEKRFRVIADKGPAAEDSARCPDPTLEEIQTILDQRGPGKIQASHPLWLASFRINDRKVKDYRHDRVFLAGDAAHIHSPAGGQGMNTGMHDACNLAWKLALAHHGHGGEFLLDTYSTERSAIGDLIVAAAGRATTIATLRGGIKQAIRNHIVSTIFGFTQAREFLADTLGELNIAYGKSPLSQSGSGFNGLLQPGHRVPVQPGEPPIGAGDTPRFALYAPPGFLADALIARYPHLLEPTVRPPLEPEALWLVRPDGYLGLAARAGDWGAAETYLNQFTPAP